MSDNSPKSPTDPKPVDPKLPPDDARPVETRVHAEMRPTVRLDPRDLKPQEALLTIRAVIEAHVARARRSE